MRWLAWFAADSWHLVSSMEIQDLNEIIDTLPEGTVWFITTTVGKALLEDMGVIN